jgi:hypothetical protein
MASASSSTFSGPSEVINHVSVRMTCSRSWSAMRYNNVDWVGECFCYLEKEEEVYQDVEVR